MFIAKRPVRQPSTPACLYSMTPLWTGTWHCWLYSAAFQPHYTNYTLHSTTAAAASDYVISCANALCIPGHYPVALDYLHWVPTPDNTGQLMNIWLDYTTATDLSKRNLPRPECSQSLIALHCAVLILEKGLRVLHEDWKTEREGREGVVRVPLTQPLSCPIVLTDRPVTHKLMAISCLLMHVAFFSHSSSQPGFVCTPEHPDKRGYIKPSINVRPKDLSQ